MRDDLPGSAVEAGDGSRPSEEDPAVDDGRVDPTLVRFMLELTPEQRLEHLQGFIDSVWEMRHGSKA